MLTRREPPRGAARPPKTYAPDDDEPSNSALGHSQHFLCRVLRCEGQDLERAMRLYHHSAIVRRLVPELMEHLLPGHDRAAIPLRPGPSAPHVVVTRAGSFVTCLGPDMTLGTLATLPYAALDLEIAKSEREIDRLRRLESIFEALPPKKLMQGLYQGPGALTREMVEVYEKDAWAYQSFICNTYLKTFDSVHWSTQTIERYGYHRKTQMQGLKADARLMQCALLMGAMDGPMIEAIEPVLLGAYTPAMWELSWAVARKPGRRKVLLDALAKVDQSHDWSRAAILDGMLMHCAWFPEEAAHLVPRVRAERPVSQKVAGWCRVWAGQQAPVTPDECVAWFTQKRAAVRAGAQEPGHSSQKMPRSPVWEFDWSELVTLAFVGWPVSAFFPPAAQGAAVAQAFAQRLRGTPEKDPRLKPGRPILRAAPRPERNALCACGSGKKYKRCCALVDPPADADQPAAPGP